MLFFSISWRPVSSTVLEPSHYSVNCVQKAVFRDSDRHFAAAAAAVSAVFQLTRQLSTD